MAVNSVTVIEYVARKNIRSPNLSLKAEVFFSDIFLYFRSVLSICSRVFFSALDFISFSVWLILFSRFVTVFSRSFKLLSNSQRWVIFSFNSFFSSSIFLSSFSFFFCNSSAFFSSKSLFCKLSFSAVTCRTRDISF